MGFWKFGFFLVRIFPKSKDWFGSSSNLLIANHSYMVFFAGFQVVPTCFWNPVMHQPPKTCKKIRWWRLFTIPNCLEKISQNPQPFITGMKTVQRSQQFLWKKDASSLSWGISGIPSWDVKMKAIFGYLSIVSSTHTKNESSTISSHFFHFLSLAQKVQWDQNERPLFPLWYLLPAPSDSRIDRFSEGIYPTEGYLANTLPPALALIPPLTMVALKPVGWVYLRSLKRVRMRIGPNWSHGCEGAAVESARTITRVAFGFNPVNVNVELQRTGHQPKLANDGWRVCLHEGSNL